MRPLMEMEHSGLVPLIEADRLEDLARLYLLFRYADMQSVLPEPAWCRRIGCSMTQQCKLIQEHAKQAACQRSPAWTSATQAL